MRRRPLVDFNQPVTEDLVVIEDLVIGFAKWSHEWREPDATDASGIGKAYEPERGDLDDRRQAKIAGMRDDEALEVSRAWAIVTRNRPAHSLVLKVHYLKGCGTVQATCRKVSIRPEDWCAMRNAGLRMISANLCDTLLQNWLNAYNGATCKPSAEELLAD